MALEGSDKDQLAVVGEDVDSAKLTCLLGKKLCYASILSVEEMKPNEEEEEEEWWETRDSELYHYNKLSTISQALWSSSLWSESKFLLHHVTNVLLIIAT